MKSILITLSILSILASSTLNHLASKFDQNLTSIQVENKEPSPKLIFEKKWGYEDDELTISENFWDTSFSYFFIRDDEVFIADYGKEKVLYYVKGVFQRSFNYPLGSIDRLFGLIVIEDVIYFFAHGQGAFGVSISNSELLHLRGFPFYPDQNQFYVYQYEKIMVVSEDTSEKGIKIRMCLDTKLTEIKCPDFMVSRNEKELRGERYQYLSSNYLGFPDLTYINNTSRPRISFMNLSTMKIEKIAHDNSKVMFDMPGYRMYNDKGLFYTIHKKDVAQIWYQPWWNKDISLK